MSYPPPPGQQPNNPYATPQQGAPAGPYGYPQQGPGQPGYGGYPGGMPMYPGGPGGPMQSVVKMPGQVITARVFLFFAGALWTLTALGTLIALTAGGAVALPGGLGPGAGSALGIMLLLFLLYAGMAALHIVPACLFGRGRSGTRITAVVAGSLNSLVPVIGFFAFLSVDTSDGAEATGGVFFYLLYLAVTVLTIVFCSTSAASQWFNRPQH
ncbi:hypothetical protein ITI46_24485 [Streptomyces oryzae]|uniref:Integral membrane protein n=1 Tax=Streptomyces oryzae TaxID=1434886 RepID=A0ABS3XHD3_9ACTN|nr:hypothetical protein [Streptomyces oryzae]MBO8194789.1 hypothetical protein [Streptomyces oryzae]